MRDREILKLIKKSKKYYYKDDQVEELLIRNKRFSKELEEVSFRLGEDFFREIERLNEEHSKKGIPISFDSSKFANYYDQWEAFCNRWNILSNWNGKISTLGMYLGEKYGLYANEEKGRKRINIEISPFTTRQDVDAIWPLVEKVQKEYYGFKAGEKPNFGRDLCWYDLNKKFNLTPRQIAKLWIENCPEDIDLLVIRRIKNKEKETLKEEDDFDLLKEIKSDPCLKELKEDFEKERKFYTTGQTEHGKFAPPFIDLIKKAISNMNKYMNQVDEIFSR